METNSCKNCNCGKNDVPFDSDDVGEIEVINRDGNLYITVSSASKDGYWETEVDVCDFGDHLGKLHYEMREGPYREDETPDFEYTIEGEDVSLWTPSNEQIIDFMWRHPNVNLPDPEPIKWETY